MDHATMIAAVAVLLTAIAALLREIRALASKALGAAATSDLILHRKLKRQQSGTLSTPCDLCDRPNCWSCFEIRVSLLHPGVRSPCNESFNQY